jgi:tetratricopeptide (TPR) repeat protein
MKCPVCRATYRPTVGSAPQTCHRCGADLTPLIRLYDLAIDHHRQAIMLFAAGNLSEAMAENDRAIALHTQQPLFHAFAGQLWAVQGDFHRAVRSWKLTQQLDPTNRLAVDCLSLIEALTHD